MAHYIIEDEMRNEGFVSDYYYWLGFVDGAKEQMEVDVKDGVSVADKNS